MFLMFWTEVSKTEVKILIPVTSWVTDTLSFQTAAGLRLFTSWSIQWTDSLTNILSADLYIDGLSNRVTSRTYSCYLLLANRRSYFPNSPDQSLILPFTVSLFTYPPPPPPLLSSSVRPSLPPFPVTTKHLFEAFRALSGERGGRPFLCFTTHQ